jgi:hypothetical protein
MDGEHVRSAAGGAARPGVGAAGMRLLASLVGGAGFGGGAAERGDAFFAIRFFDDGEEEGAASALGGRAGGLGGGAAAAAAAQEGAGAASPSDRLARAAARLGLDDLEPPASANAAESKEADALTGEDLLALMDSLG